MGSDNTATGTQQNVWPTVGDTLIGVFSPSFCSAARYALVGVDPAIQRCVVLGWDREVGRETQERGDMGIYVYV